MRKFFQVITLCIMLPLTSFAWWNEGHKTIAEIAYRHLSIDAKHQVDHLVNVFKKHDGDDHDLYFMAVWPDILGMNGVRIFHTWHYIDQPYYVDDVPKQEVLLHDNVILAINEAKRVLLKPKVPEYERARFLSFLIHTVGDVHQPLHAIARISYDHPEGDRGGNDFKISYTAKHHTHINNLHAMWDSAVGQMDRFHFKDIVIRRDADLIESHFPFKTLEKEAHDLDPQHWAQESYEIGKNNVYDLPEHSTPTDDYVKKNVPVAEKRIALAGYRLAYVLNQIFHSDE